MPPTVILAGRFSCKVFAEGLDRPAIAGEVIEVPAGVAVKVELEFLVPAQDWEGKPNRVDEIELILADSWEVYFIDEHYHLAADGYEVDACFLDDWKPLSVEDVERAAIRLAWSRVDLLEAVYSLSSSALNAAHPGERWSIAGILEHIDGGEQWYLDRLGLAACHMRSVRTNVNSSPLSRRLESIWGMDFSPSP